MGVAGWGIWKNGTLRERPFLIPLIFILLEITRLTLTRATFFSRYFIPILWLTLIFFGMGLGALWSKLKADSVSRSLFLSLFALWATTHVVVGISFAGQIREVQTFRHEASLKAMGLWLKDNTPPQSRILLEPLGYVGYYSERTMIEEVGLVTPSVTELKRQQIGNEKYTAIFKPDYVIVHCGDEIRIPQGPQAEVRYTLAKTFNPLGFNGVFDPQHTVVWTSCYEIWEKDE